MITENALVVYKNKPALVKGKADGKTSISLVGGEQLKVRDKDIELLHPGQVKNLDEIENISIKDTDAVREAWELLSTSNDECSLKDLAVLIFGDFTPSFAYSTYLLLQDGLYFYGSINDVKIRSEEEVFSEEAKRSEKEREGSERISFLERIKACLKNPKESPLPADDIRFMQDVQALALGKSAKSRTLKELGISETPEDAHSLLLKTGAWTVMENPHPSRFGLSFNSASLVPDTDFNDERHDLCRLVSYAIDSPWSCDPDDALSIEEAAGRTVLYVHVADPAAFIAFDSPAEKEARNRGATLYLPETTVRMLSPELLPKLALGISDNGISPALTFKMTLDENCDITETEIFHSLVKVKRITYEGADKLLETDETLRALYKTAQKYFKRRTDAGAVSIEMPEVRITVENNEVKIEQVAAYSSNFLVKECMILAGEAAGNWASQRGIAFPYVLQEVELQGNETPDGFAGAYQLRRCMRGRLLSAKPSSHQGLGLDIYSQVTSPLRRYTDLLAHMQICAILRGEKPLGTDEISSRLGFCEAAMSAVNHAERASINHWIMVYLSDKKDSEWEAVVLEKKGNRWAVVIPSLALETQVSLHGNVSPNDEIKLVLKSVNIARLEAVFVQVD